MLISLLLTTPYVLTYAIPLLLLSLILTFTGTFLTLDRSRFFPPISEVDLPTPGAFSQKRAEHKFVRFLEGGAGGLLSGYAFGLHTSTALALIIPATTASASLSPKAFLALWLLSCIITTTIAGRFRYAAIVFTGISGGALTALPFCVIIHPSLPGRIIVVSIFIPIFTILSLAAFIIPSFSARCLHPILRFCTASSGAFGVVLAIALLLSPKPGAASWANVWERLWVKDGTTWGSAGEKGLTAAYAFFLIAGIVSDWSLHRWIGECPDEKWDSYLANYTATLPNQPDRVGTFQPFTSFWDKIFPNSSLPSFPSNYNGKTAVIFPPEKLSSSHNLVHNLALQSPENLKKAPILSSLSGVVTTAVDVFKKPQSKGFTKWKKNTVLGLSETRRKPIKFGAIEDLSSGSDASDSEFDELTEQGPKEKQKSPWNWNSHSSSTHTYVDGRIIGKKALTGSESLIHNIDSEIKIQKQAYDTLDYSDYEEDLSTAYHDSDHINKTAARTDDHQGWQPGFLKRYHATAAGGGHHSQSAKPVPVTRSLIKALDRIAVAQKDAFRPRGIGVNAPNLTTVQVGAAGSPKRGGGIKSGVKKGPKWEDFWREVREKAQTRG